MHTNIYILMYILIYTYIYTCIYMYAANMLTAAAAEIEAEMESRPMRVIFIKADPGAASMMISIIMTVIGFQIYGASALQGFVS